MHPLIEHLLNLRHVRCPPFSISCISLKTLGTCLSEDMFQIRKSFTFEASHRLLYHDGKCADMHGHSYKLIVELSGEHLQRTGPETNMLLDFQNVSIPVKKLVKTHLDHRHLNDSLDTHSPTAEYIAWWVYQRLKSSIPTLTAVTICETATSSATYRPTTHCPGCTCHSIAALTNASAAPITDAHTNDTMAVKETKHVDG